MNSIRPRISAGPLGSAGSWIWGSSSRSVNIFSAEATADWRVESCSARSWMGSKKVLMYCKKMYMVPKDTVPASTPRLPAAMTMAMAATEHMTITGRNTAPTRISRRKA